MTILEQKKYYYNEIRTYIEEQKKNGIECAVWGAGKKGKDFLETVDPNGEYIRYVFDLDDSKIGKIVTSVSHIVSSWQDNYDKVRYVFIVMQYFAGETIKIMRSAGYRSDFISVDDWVLGGQNQYDQKKMEIPKLLQVRKVRIGALVILYEPDEYVLNNIISYIDSVDCLYIWDNSLENNINLISGFLGSKKIKYYSEGINRGLGYPINRIADLMSVDGLEWMITFDQDSQADFEMIDTMRQYVESDIYSYDVDMVVPIVLEPTGMSENFIKHLPYCTYVNKAVQSGAMHNVKAINRIKYNEDYFIDNVDFNFCVRLRNTGKKIIRLNRAKLHHQVGLNKIMMRESDGFRFYVNKYNSCRYYYQYRNMLYDRQYFMKIDPDYSMECEMGIKKVETMVKYELNRVACEEAIACAKRDYEKGVTGPWLF